MIYFSKFVILFLEIFLWNVLWYIEKL